MPFPQQERVGKAATEFIGTFFLCLTVSMAAALSPIAPIAIGFVLMVLVYAGGHESGAHYNPAVTLAIAVSGRNKIAPIDAVIYIFSQLVGGVLGQLMSWPLMQQSNQAWIDSAYPQVGAGVSAGAAVLGEIVVTMALCSVVLHTATTTAEANNSYYGLAIGCTVLSGAVSVGPVSGGAFNPAVGLMSALYGGDAAANCWIYFVGPLTGGILAGLLFRLCAVEEYTENPSEAREAIANFANEAFGTMFLCFTVGTAASAKNSSALAPLSIGSALMVMVYMGGAVSGAHYNPAVTLGLYIRTLFGATHDNFSLKKLAYYIPGQILGAALATFLAWGVMEGAEFVGYPALPATKDAGSGVLGEALGTFLLVYVVLNVATVKNLAGNSFFGLAIGMAVTSMACAIGPITGGAFNPAVGLIGVFSGNVFNYDGGQDVWIYWVGCPLGAALAAAFFRLQNFQEFETENTDLKNTAHATLVPSKQKLMAHAHTRSRFTPVPEKVSGEIEV